MRISDGSSLVIYSVFIELEKIIQNSGWFSVGQFPAMASFSIASVFEDVLREQGAFSSDVDLASRKAGETCMLFSLIISGIGLHLIKFHVSLNVE